jgi:hypothetical protein
MDCSDLLELDATDLETIANDESRPFVERKFAEMISSENPLVSLPTIKYLIEQKNLKKSDSPLDITDKITMYGKLQYTKAQIIGLHPELNIADLKKDLTTGKLKKLYDYGVALGDYEIDSKLYEKASSGDIKALDQLKIRQMSRE